MTLRVITPDWPAPVWVKAIATERCGGVSSGVYGGFNLGTNVGDQADAVAKNRQLLRAELKLPEEPNWLEQVHGSDVLDLDAVGSSVADAAVTGKPGRVCAVLTADCLPVLFSTVSGERVGAAHAGWRGLSRGVLSATVAAMGVAPDDIMAWLGPAIGQVAYEVGDDVHTAFVTADPGMDECFVRNFRGRWQADLYGLARHSLAVAGVDSVYGGGFCTFTEKERFYSYRREAPCGRQVTLIWRLP
ncbi:MAG: peptidoglycan editing factor PgeF [Candidatus Rariloculaceae bacterium]